jgi:hypothetical protein
MRSIRDAMRYQADFQLLSAAASAAQGLHASVATGDGETARMKAMSDLMKLAHVRQRFAPEEPPQPIRESVLEELVCTAHPNGTIDALRSEFRRHTGHDLKAEWDARREAEAQAGVRRELLLMRPIRLNPDNDIEDIEDADQDPQHALGTHADNFNDI